jgi:hypothetical protein
VSFQMFSNMWCYSLPFDVYIESSYFYLPNVCVLCWYPTATSRHRKKSGCQESTQNTNVKTPEDKHRQYRSYEKYGLGA